MRTSRNPRSLACCALLGSLAISHAAVVPNPLFTSHAVLQHDRVIPIWGTADPGEKITVRP